MASEPSSAAAAQARRTSQLHNLGQDTTQLYERQDQKKAWRVEHAPTQEEKELAAERAADFMKDFPMEHQVLDDVHTNYLEYVQKRIDEGPPQHHTKLRERLVKAQLAQAELARFETVHHAEYAFHGGSCDFVSYVRGKEHGTRERLRAPKPRGQPYPRGKVKGASAERRAPSALADAFVAFVCSQVPYLHLSVTSSTSAAARPSTSRTIHHNAWLTTRRARLQWTREADGARSSCLTPSGSRAQITTHSSTSSCASSPYLIINLEETPMQP